MLEVAADKVNVEIEAPADGELLDVSAKEADCIQFGAVLAVIDKPLEPVGRRRNYSSLELKHVGRSRWGSVPCPPTEITPAKPILIPFFKLPIIKRFHSLPGGRLRTFGNVTASRFALRVREA